MCNEKIYYSPDTVQTTSNPIMPKPVLFTTLLYSLVPIMGIAAILLFSSGCTATISWPTHLCSCPH
ncbi:hypothetical protein NFI96_021465, partial [Prochilodus magdalenae]